MVPQRNSRQVGALTAWGTRRSTEDLAGGSALWRRCPLRTLSQEEQDPRPAKGQLPQKTRPSLLLSRPRPVFSARLGGLGFLPTSPEHPPPSLRGSGLLPVSTCPRPRPSVETPKAGLDPHLSVPKLPAASLPGMSGTGRGSGTAVSRWPAGSQGHTPASIPQSHSQPPSSSRSAWGDTQRLRGEEKAQDRVTLTCGPGPCR